MRNKRIITMLIACLLAAALLLVSGCEIGDLSIEINGKENSDAISSSVPAADAGYTEYRFRNADRLNEHFEKHGKEMGFADAQEYEKAASDVINNPESLTKTEAEDGDFVYYLEKTNEFVILSKDGYIRTYFLPDAGKNYYDRQ